MLKGEQIYLRLINKSDISILYDIYSEINVNKYNWGLKNIPDKQFILSNFYKLKNSLKSSLTIINEKKVVVGCISYDCIDKERNIYSLSIFLGSRFWGRGYGRDSIRILSKYIFDRYKAHEIELEVVKDNERAINCYKNIGFREKNIKNNSYNLDGNVEDILVMVLDRNNLNKQII